MSGQYYWKNSTYLVNVRQLPNLWRVNERVVLEGLLWTSLLLDTCDVSSQYYTYKLGVRYCVTLRETIPRSERTAGAATAVFITAV